MPRTPYRIEQLKEQHGDLERVIPPMVNALGQRETARKLDVSQSTISRWLKDNGYTLKITFVKEMTE